MRLKVVPLVSIAAAVLMGQAARGQAVGFGGQPGTLAGAPPAGPAAANGLSPGALANPFVNPYMNPYLNPYMTTQPMNRNDMLLYFMAGQKAQGAVPGTAAAAGIAQTPSTLQPPGGRPAPQRPRPNATVTPRARPNAGGPVAGRFNDRAHYFNDGRGNLAARYPAFGSSMIDAQGGPMVPGLSPAPNEGVGRYFNRNPAYNRNNGR